MLTLALMFFTGLSGCDLLNPDVAAYCEEAMDCLDGNDEDLKSCKAQVRHEKERARIYDCSDDHDDWVECLFDDSDCEDYEGTDYWTDEDKCDDDWEDYIECLDDESKVIDLD